MSDPTLLVLASLAEGDKHGYAMMEDIERFAGQRLGPGTLYGAITRLEERGWIRPVHAVDRRQPYAITPAGKQYLEEQLATLDRVVRTAMRRLKVPRSTPMTHPRERASRNPTRLRPTLTELTVPSTKRLRSASELTTPVIAAVLSPVSWASSIREIEGRAWISFKTLSSV